MIDEVTKQKIIDTAHIVDVVSDFVSLRRAGVDYIGLCPFHADRRPSFHVSPSKNICKCFSCGEGGTPVSFLMKLEKMTFPEALPDYPDQPISVSWVSGFFVSLGPLGPRFPRNPS